MSSKCVIHTKASTEIPFLTAKSALADANRGIKRGGRDRKEKKKSWVYHNNHNNRSQRNHIHKTLLSPAIMVVQLLCLSLEFEFESTKPPSPPLFHPVPMFLKNSSFQGLGVNPVGPGVSPVLVEPPVISIPLISHPAPMGENIPRESPASIGWPKNPGWKLEKLVSIEKTFPSAIVGTRLRFVLLVFVVVAGELELLRLLWRVSLLSLREGGVKEVCDEESL